MNDIISIEGLNKFFPGNVHAVDNLDMSVREGEIFAFLGPNEAGRTIFFTTHASIAIRGVFLGREVPAYHYGVLKALWSTLLSLRRKTGETRSRLGNLYKEALRF